MGETVKAFRKEFDTLTGTEQRDMIEKVIKKIVVHRDNRLELVVYGSQPLRAAPSVTGRNKSTEREINGGVDLLGPNPT